MVLYKRIVCFVMTMIDGGVLCVKSKVAFFFSFQIQYDNRTNLVRKHTL